MSNCIKGVRSLQLPAENIYQTAAQTTGGFGGQLVSIAIVAYDQAKQSGSNLFF